MNALAPTPRVRTVDPTSYVPLASFSCGGSSDYEREVDDIVADLHRGRSPWESVRVAEAPGGDRMGLCLLQRRGLPGAAPDAAYIGLLSVAAGWRGSRLPDGGRLGSLLLGDSLEQVMEI